MDELDEKIRNLKITVTDAQFILNTLGTDEESVQKTLLDAHIESMIKIIDEIKIKMDENNEVKTETNSLIENIKSIKDKLGILNNIRKIIVLFCTYFNIYIYSKNENVDTTPSDQQSSSTVSISSQRPSVSKIINSMAVAAASLSPQQPHPLQISKIG